METRPIDLTEGRPITRILIFAIPLVLGTLFQQLYSFMDTIMVGRFLGTNALAAVGATYSLNFLIHGFGKTRSKGMYRESVGTLLPERTFEITKKLLFGKLYKTEK